MAMRRWIGRVFCMEMLGGLGITQSCQSCLIRLLGFCMNIMQSLTVLLGCPFYLMTEAGQMCMVCCIQIRYFALCIYLYLLHYSFTAHILHTESSTSGHSSSPEVIWRQRAYSSLFYPCHWSHKASWGAKGIVLSISKQEIAGV